MPLNDEIASLSLKNQASMQHTVGSNYSPIQRNTTEVLRFESQDSHVMSDYDATYKDHSNLQMT